MRRLFAWRGGRKTGPALAAALLVALLATAATASNGHGPKPGKGPKKAADVQPLLAAPAAASTGPGQSFAVTLTPESVSADVGGEVALTALLTEGGDPEGGEPIHFRVTGANPQTANSQTGVDGRTVLTYTGANPGVDTVTACFNRDESDKHDPEDDDGNESKKYCDTSTVTWGNAVADLSVDIDASDDEVGVGDQVTYTAKVTNNGPATATGVILTYEVPNGFTLVSSSTTQGSCSGTTSVTCTIGTLAAGESATATFVVTAKALGSYTNTVDVAGDQPDPPAPGPNSSSVGVDVDTPGPRPPEPLLVEEQPEGPFQPPEIVQGQTFEVQRVEGTVRVKPRGSTSFVPLTADRVLTVGSVIDASKGLVEITTAVDTQGRLQGAVFYGGTFSVLQKKSALTELKLTGGNRKKACKGAASASDRRLAAVRKKPIRKLWGNGTGSYRTSGAYSSATVRGTKWYVADTCEGTLTKVSRGVVKVYDLQRRRYITLSAGQSYLAKP